jgi:hypothetical protein
MSISCSRKGTIGIGEGIHGHVSDRGDPYDLGDGCFTPPDDPPER